MWKKHHCTIFTVLRKFVDTMIPGAFGLESVGSISFALHGKGFQNYTLRFSPPLLHDQG